jgi:hypothetical protein
MAELRRDRLTLLGACQSRKKQARHAKADLFHERFHVHSSCTEEVSAA